MALATCANHFVSTEWTPNLEDMVRSWALKSVIQRELHHHAAKYYKIWSTRLSMPVILLTTLTSVGSFGAVDSEQYKMWMYATGGLNLVSAFLASMMKYLKPDERCATHGRMSKMFDAYYRDLTVQLNLSPQERSHPETIIETYKTRLETLIDESPLISDTLTKETMEKHNICPPNDFCINIYGRNLESRPI